EHLQHHGRDRGAPRGARGPQARAPRARRRHPGARNRRCARHADDPPPEKGKAGPEGPHSPDRGPASSGHHRL
ncbi:MAG: hypothetical protein AVDCRST_MAG15-3279, partial [uncultured Rubellimicrobium sp.]